MLYPPSPLFLCHVLKLDKVFWCPYTMRVSESPRSTVLDTLMSLPCACTVQWDLLIMDTLDLCREVVVFLRLFCNKGTFRSSFVERFLFWRLFCIRRVYYKGTFRSSFVERFLFWRLFCIECMIILY